MSLKQTSSFFKAWHKWKTLRLPWRRQILAGLDLQGNTYWEFRDARTSSPGAAGAETTRARRIVRYPPRTHPSDVAVPPAWHQWLRHTRSAAPTLDEQHADAARQLRMKALAAQADARWAAAAAADGAPGKGAEGQAAPAPATKSRVGSREGGGHAPGVSPADAAGAGDAGRVDAAGDRGQSWRKMQEEEKVRAAGPGDPWKRARGPSEKWQPKGWDPSGASKQR
ncbi:hypothetical protein QBC33DRAFT_568805 [Phialemonium atrogriseum]|uniref:NADH dehydrogenase [ubiquinone] 1 alpha subcomplex subunit n=1 Tax=Phialemonium atrogriseum TaxID=1093897 RepID=A0AAJ0C1L5_9PEZI|nr:uncharacterized protein QBC33DRAFT_568805 [Phialemonium atrogriseum]KAK1768459.1 hypothetical protein QBC33DRAFT_568805 [Phialemonium atrogriseum]